MIWDSPAWFAVASALLGAATLWSGHRRSAMDALRTRVDTLEDELKDVRRQLDESEVEVRRLTKYNNILLDQINDNKSRRQSPPRQPSG